MAAERAAPALDALGALHERLAMIEREWDALNTLRRSMRALVAYYERNPDMLTGHEGRLAVPTRTTRSGRQWVQRRTYFPKPCCDCGTAFAPSGPRSARCESCRTRHSGRFARIELERLP